MFKYVSKRLGLMLFTFFIIFTMCFVLIKLLPIPTNALPGQDPEIVMKTLEGRGWITNIKEGENGVWTYDRVPIMIQFGTYIKRIVTQGDFGIVTTYGEYLNMNIWEVFVSHLPPTILINIYSTLIGVPIGLGLGILAALKKNKWQDQVINIVIILLISVPSIVLALMIQYVFCFKLGWFPLTMSTSTITSHGKSSVPCSLLCLLCAWDLLLAMPVIHVPSCLRYLQVSSCFWREPRVLPKSRLSIVMRCVTPWS